MTKRYVYAIIALVPAVLLVWAIVKAVTQHRYYGQPIAVTKINPRYRAVIEQWNALNSDSARPISTSQLAAMLAGQAAPLLDRVQAKSLKHVINDSLDALDSVSFADYLYYKTNSLPSPHISLSAMRLYMESHYHQAESQIGKADSVPVPDTRSESLADAKLMWSAMHASSTNLSAAFVNKVVVQKSFCKVDTISSSNLVSSLGSIVLDLLPKYPNTGIYTSPSAFSGGDSPESVFNRNGGSLLVAYAYLLISDWNNNCFPLLLRYYWSPNQQTWIPQYLFVCNVNSDTVVFF